MPAELHGGAGPDADALPADTLVRWSAPNSSPATVNVLTVAARVVLGFIALTVLVLIPGWLLVNLGPLSGVRAWDLGVSRWVVDHRTAGLDSLVPRAGRIADTVPVVVAALVVEAILILRRRWAALLILAIGLALELSVFLTVNTLVARPRPDVAKLGDEPSTYSYPSGHVAATIVLWGSVAALLTLSARHHRGPWRWLAWAGVVVVAAVVAFSRIYRGMHHLTDVAAGAVLGVAALAVALAITWWVERGGPDPTPEPVHHQSEEVAA